MLRLGHIEYSNCLPVHAQLLESPTPEVRIVHGSPGELNEALAQGVIDVAPCSSIEYARHAHRYRVIPGLAIGSRGSVRSIRLESTRPPEQLHGCRVAVPTASASSVVLLRILLERRHGSRPDLVWFAQESDEDPIAEGATAALWIGDQALQRPARSDRHVYDLGEQWTAWTGLPFAFALWQTCLGSERDAELRALAIRLHESLRVSLAQPRQLAERYADRFGLAAGELAEYWTGLHYQLDHTMLRGLLHFYQLAQELGEIEAVPVLHWLSIEPARV
ncbi:MAG: menaquinone biosynthetic enzyme MqnA/MqnD family protein [Longimicrobiales bacterium]